MDPRVHFCTFGSLPTYERALHTLCKEAKESGYFASVTAYTQNNLPANRNELDFMSRNPKGYGFWIWKSILLEDMLSQSPEGDIVLYADAGCGISVTDKARSNMKAWISDCVSHPTHRISFQMTHIEETWTKGDVFVLLGAEGDEFRKTGQHIGTIHMYQNTQDNRAFVRMYKDFVAAETYHHVSDAKSRVRCSRTFKAHRHDQSISSILFKKYGSASRPDHWCDPDFPVVALRQRGG